MNIPTYLLLVSFLTGFTHNITMDKLEMVNRSPYHGVGISITDAYEDRSYTIQDYAKFCELITSARKSYKWNKDIWPWVFLNRIIAVSNPPPIYLKDRKFPAYYSNIKVMDINGKTEALNCFYQDWSNALTICKYTNSIGVVLDDESYNNRRLTVKQIANAQELPDDKVRQDLRAIGASMIKIATQIKPDVVILILCGKMSELSNIDLKPMDAPQLYIFAGMFDQAKGSKIKIVAGGEDDCGYCFLNKQDLLRTLARRQRHYAPIQSKYPDNFVLGGTIAPFNNLNWRSQPSDFTSNKCSKAEMQNAEDFVPLFKELFKAYPYVWIYATGKLGYYPYDPGIAPAFNMAIQRGLEYR